MSRGFSRRFRCPSRGPLMATSKSPRYPLSETRLGQTWLRETRLGQTLRRNR